MSRLTAAACVAACLTIAGCGSDSLDRPIRFVVPDGFEGYLALVIDDTHGSVIDKTPDAYLFNVPASGVVLSERPDEIYSWHVTEAVTAAGKRLSIKSASTHWGDTRGEVLFFVVGGDELQRRLNNHGEARQHQRVWLEDRGLILGQ